MPTPAGAIRGKISLCPSSAKVSAYPFPAAADFRFRFNLRMVFVLLNTVWGV